MLALGGSPAIPDILFARFVDANRLRDVKRPIAAVQIDEIDEIDVVLERSVQRGGISESAHSDRFLR